MFAGVGVDCPGTLEQNLFCQNNPGVPDTAVYRADCDTLLPVKKANALGAQILFDDVR